MIKKHIAEDMHGMAMEDICYLLQLFKDDMAFSKYLATNLLRKMKNGAKLDFESFLIALVSSLQHKDHLDDLVDALLNFEQFHTDKSLNFIKDLLSAAADQELHKHPAGVRLINAL